MGWILVTGSGKSITNINFLDEKPNIFLTTTDAVVVKCIDELVGYLSGTSDEFTVPVRPKGTDFQQLVWRELQKIPRGTTIDYETLAIRVGDIKAIRAVGTANGKNPIPIIIPCHRVIGKDGSLVGFSSGLKRKAWLLEHEAAIAKQLDMFNK